MSSMRKQKGLAALMITITMLIIVTIITLFTVRVLTTDNKIFRNMKDNSQALDAAQAGFDYALGYLNVNPFLVVTGLGYCAAASNTYALTPGSLTGGSTYTMTFSCVTAGSFITFNLTAVGTSPDGTATRTVRATLKQYCGVSIPLITRSTSVVGTVATPIVTNQRTGATRTVSAGGTVTLSNSGSATTITGGNYNCAANYPPASPAGTCLNVASSSGLGSLSQAVQFPQLYLGRLLTDFSALAPVYRIDCTSGNKTFNQTTTFTSAGCTNSGSGGGGVTLSGITGAIIYINMGTRNLTLNTPGGGVQTFTLGSLASPVILVITGTGTVTINPGANDTFTLWGNIYTQGNLTIDKVASATTTLRGLVFGQGDVIARDGVTVNGAIVSNTATIRDNSRLTYDSSGATYISNTRGGYCGGSYGIVSGSWRNF